MVKISLMVLALFLFSGCIIENTENQNTTEHKTQKIPKNSVAMLGVLVNYANQKIVSDDSAWSDKLFGSNDGELNSYYMQVSANNFKYEKVKESSSIINDGIVSVELNKNHPNTDVDNSLFETLAYPDLKLALEQLDEYVDFSNYDSDANGHITPDELSIVFIIAGYEDAYEGRHVRNGTWGHQNCMNDAANVPILDGVSIMKCADGGNFALFGELHEKRTPHDATIGIIAHELGHATFNLPDLYNTNDPNSGGIGYFGIMGSGTWGTKNDGEYAGQTPTHFSAWSKVYNGWITPIIKKESVVLYATSMSQYNIVKIPINETSYYLVENRDNSGYDRGLNSLEGDFQGGIALWKIDETKLTQAHIRENDVNTDSENKGVDLVEAVDGDIDYTGDGGAENALFYDGNVNYFSTRITNITQPGQMMGLNIN